MAICAGSQFQLNRSMLFLGGVYAAAEDILASFATKANAN
jgi:hypothetical protein